VYRRELLDDVGCFDECFETYLEDLDLSLRAQLRGWKCLAVPEARVSHEGHLSTGGFANPEVVRLLARNWIQLLIKSVPRRVLRRNAIRIVGTSLRQGVYHTVKSRHPLAYVRGIVQGLFRVRDLVARRQSILGWRRVDDQRIEELLVLGDGLLESTRAARFTE
jgi:GT2 family glycosyltransferase